MSDELRVVQFLLVKVPGCDLFPGSNVNIILSVWDRYVSGLSPKTKSDENSAVIKSVKKLRKITATN